MTSVNYQFIEYRDTNVNYSFMVEKESCKSEETRVKYLFLEYSEDNK